MIRNCLHCQEDFDDTSPEKKRAGGKIFQCPECATETVVKYVGFQAADGKQSQISILQFDSEEDKRSYVHFWQNNSGMHKGKSCQLGSHLSTTPKLSFRSITNFSPTNHKGKHI